MDSARLAPSLQLGQLFALSLVVGLGACDTPAQPAARAEPAEPAATSERADTPAGEAEPSAKALDGGSSVPLAEGETPPWFSADAFEHEKVVRPDERSSKMPSGMSSRMILLQLKAGTTTAQCLELARAKLGETIPDLPANTESPQGYPMISGKTATYEYSVVCGDAKGSPTMFMSIVQ